MPFHALIIPWFRGVVFPEVNRYIVNEGIEILPVQKVSEVVNYLVNLGSSALRATEGVLWFRNHLSVL